MQGVVKNSSKTTKLHAVFDASAKTTSGCSLKDLLLAGPSLYSNLSTVISKFRCHHVAITGDISKMFRGILLHAEITRFSSILPLVRLKTGGCCTSHLFPLSSYTGPSSGSC